MIRPGRRGRSGRGRKTLWSTPTGTTVMRAGSTPIWAAMSFLEDSETVTTRGSSPRHAHLHAEKPEPAALGQTPVGVLGVRQRQHPVDGDRVVQGREQGPPVLEHAEQARPQALVVVDHVELGTPGGQQSARPEGERARLGEAGAAHDGELEQVDGGVELPRVRHAKGIGVAVEVEPGHGLEPHAVVEHGPRLTGEDVDRVAERHELACQVAGVDALAAAARVPAVDEVGDAQPARLGPDPRPPGGHLEAGAALPRRPDLGQALARAS